MSSLRAFRIQKSRPITSSPSSVGDTGDLASPSSASKRLDCEEPNSSQETQNGSNGNSNNHLDDSSEDIVRPLVRFDIEIEKKFQMHFMPSFHS